MRFRERVERESGPVPAAAPAAFVGGCQPGGNQMMVRLLSGGAHLPAEPDLAERIGGRLGRGRPLPDAVRSDMETSFGREFGGVMIHRDAEADSLARQLGARAFTTGQDVFFASGAYDPESSQGRATLAHELVHTVQQGSGSVAGAEVAPGVAVSDPHDREEREATAIAQRLPERGEVGPMDALRLRGRAGNAATTKVLRVQRDAAIHAGDGTTPELQAELTRLRAEQSQHSFWTGEYRSYKTPIERLELLLAERADTGMAYSDVSLSFDGRTLSMFAPTSLSWAAVSGRPMPGGGFDYSPDRQRLANEGPIPAGTYWVDPKQMTDLRYRWVSGDSWGTHRITIHPDANTATFGRGGFFIHGGSVPGSIGCIDLTSNIAAFADALARNVRSGTRVRLVVSYPQQAPDVVPDNSTRAA